MTNRKLLLKNSILSCLFILLYTMVNGQVFSGQKAFEKLKEAKAIRYVKESQYPQYVAFRDDIKIEAQNFLPWIRESYQIKEQTKLDLIHHQNDHLGFEHFKYQQLHHNVPVIGGIYIAHVKDNFIHSVNGEIFNVPVNLSTIPSIDGQSAFNKAMAYTNAEKYAFEIDIPYVGQQENIPVPTLVIVPENLDFKNSNFKLAYKIDIHALYPLSRNWLYVDAHSGEIIAKENRICFADVEGTAITKWSGEQTITVDDTGNGFRLRETGRGNGIQTLNMNNNTDYSSAIDFTDSDNFWDNVNPDQDEVATDCHWGVEKSYDYFFEKFNRNSFDDQGAVIRSYIHYDNDYGNAFWNGQALTFGDGNPGGTLIAPLVTIDICAHELAHGVTEYSAGLIYADESGALNESFSDIFGAAVDFYARPNLATWIIGNEVTSGGVGIRSMSDPNIHNNPDTYQGDFWFDGADVHTNSGVQNHWFYLLAEGGSGFNDFGNDFNVNGIGIDNASAIAYRNLNVYLTPSSNYVDAAFLSRVAATDLFDGCSDEVIQTINAWYAVGIGELEFEPDALFTTKQVYCSLPAEVEFSNLSSFSNSAFWDFGDGNTSTVFHPTHTYASQGTYTVQLTATGCNGEEDIESKINYIVVDPNHIFCDTTIMPITGLTTINACAGVIADDGGALNYSNNVEGSILIQPPNATFIALEFTAFDLEFGDFITIHDGADINAPLIGNYTGNNSPGMIVSSGGAITIIISSNNEDVSSGFSATFIANGNTATPSANFEMSSQNTPLNAPVEFTIPSSVLGQIIWDFGDGNISNDSNPIHYYQTPGTYTVTLSIDNCNGSDETTQTIVVQESAQLISYSPDSICVTLLAGEQHNEIITILSEGDGDFYYQILQNSLIGISDTSSINYNQSSLSSTTHVFDTNGNLNGFSLEVTVNGDYDNEVEYAEIFIEGTLIGSTEGIDLSNGVDIVLNFEFSDNEISDWILDEMVEVEIVNSSQVSTNEGGEDSHTVSFNIPDFTWLVIESPTAITPTGTHEIVVTLDATGLIGGTYNFDLLLENNDLDNSLITIPVKLIVLPFPVASFQLSTNVSCDGLVNFYNNSLNDPLTWEWDFGDGGNSSDENPTHQYTENGMYDVTLIACNDLGCDTIIRQNIISINIDTPFCDTLNWQSNGTAYLTSCSGVLHDSGGAAGNYSNGEFALVVIEPEGASTVVLEFDEFNLQNYYDKLIIYDGNNNNAPEIGTYSGNTLPEGGMIVSSQSAISLLFDSNGSITNSGFTIRYSSDGVASNPQADFELVSSNVPLNAPVQFNNLSNAFGGWEWNFGDGSTSAEENPIHYFQAPGIYTVTLILDLCGGYDTYSQEITVQEAPLLSSLQPDSICVTLIQGQQSIHNITFENEGIGSLYYSVDPQTFASPIDTSSINYSTSNASTFHQWNVPDDLETLKFTVINNGDFDHELKYAEVYVDGDFIEVIEDYNIENGVDIIQHFELDNQNYNVSDWVADGVIQIEIRNAFVVTTNDGGSDNHTVIYNTNSNEWLSFLPMKGTISTDNSATIETTINTTNTAPGTYTNDIILNVNDTQTNQLSIPIKLIVLPAPTSTPQIEEAQQLLLFPNPTSGKFNLSYNGSFTKDFSIIILNTLGQVVYEEKLGHTNSFEKILDLSNQEKGIYFINIKTTEGILTKKLILQ